MDKKISFVQQLGIQLKQLQLQKIYLADDRYKKIPLKQNQFNAKQTLIDLGDANQSTYLNQDSIDICRWNHKKYDCQTNRQIRQLSLNKITKRNNLMTQRYHGTELKLQNLRSASSRQIPQLKLLLQKLSTPTNKRKSRIQQRQVLTSARRNKHQSQHQQKTPQRYPNIQQLASFQPSCQPSKQVSLQKKRRPHTNDKNIQNRNPTLYPTNQIIKQKSKYKDYQKINRTKNNPWNVLNPSLGTNQMVHEKEMLQNLIRNTINSNNSHNNTINKDNTHAFNFLKQYSNLNYFSGNFKNQTRKKGTLANILA